MIETTFSMKSAFFDRKAIQELIGKKQSHALMKMGSHIRRTARTLQRQRKRPSKPGQAPSVHSGEPNLRTVLYAWVENKRKMIIGPVRLTSKKSSPAMVPRLMEKGGKILSVQRRLKPQFATSKKKRTRRNQENWQQVLYKKTSKHWNTKYYDYRTKMVTIAPRPYMRPALDENRSKFPDLFRDILKP